MNCSVAQICARLSYELVLIFEFSSLDFRMWTVSLLPCETAASMNRTGE